MGSDFERRLEGGEVTSFLEGVKVGEWLAYFRIERRLVWLEGRGEGRE